MTKTILFVLAVLFLLPSVESSKRRGDTEFVSWGQKTTAAPETQAPETQAPETQAPEGSEGTQAPEGSEGSEYPEGSQGGSEYGSET
jgi:hypothetical protein